MLWDAAHQHHVSHGFQNTQAVDPPCNPDRQAFPGELIDQRHQPDFAAIVGLGLHQVVGPDMVAALRSQPDDPSLSHNRPRGFCFQGTFSPLAAPDALDPLRAHIPARLVEQLGDPPVAIAPILGCQRQDGLGQPIFVSPGNDRITLRATGLADDPAGLASES